MCVCVFVAFRPSEPFAHNSSRLPPPFLGIVNHDRIFLQYPLSLSLSYSCPHDFWTSLRWEHHKEASIRWWKASSSHNQSTSCSGGTAHQWNVQSFDDQTPERPPQGVQGRRGELEETAGLSFWSYLARALFLVLVGNCSVLNSWPTFPVIAVLLTSCPMEHFLKHV